MFDAVIVGAGSFGLGTGYFASRAGLKVLLLDPGDPPHAQGAHHGATRLIRHAYGEGASYVPLALRAQQIWLDLERETATKLFEPTGIINAGPADDPFIAEVQRSAAEHDLTMEVIDGAQANRRWPAWHLPHDMAVCFEPDAGVLYCEKAVGVLRQLAIAQGATLRTNAPVTRIEAHAGSATVVTAAGEKFTGRHVLVSAGKSTRGLVGPLGLRLPITRVRKTFGWFDGAPEIFDGASFPGFCVITPLGWHYGIPNLEGRGLKAGRHDGGQPVAEHDPLAPFGPADQADIDVFLRRHLPGAGQLREGSTCEYDMTPDEHFIVDSVPGFPHIHVAAGFSGHGFKFATSIGEALAQRIAGNAGTADLSRFACTRFKQ